MAPVGLGPIVDKIRCRKGIVLAVAGVVVGSAIRRVASDQIGSLWVMLLGRVRSRAVPGSPNRHQRHLPE